MKVINQIAKLLGMLLGAFIAAPFVLVFYLLVGLDTMLNLLGKFIVELGMCLRETSLWIMKLEGFMLSFGGKEK